MIDVKGMRRREVVFNIESTIKLNWCIISSSLVAGNCIRKRWYLFGFFIKFKITSQHELESILI